MPFNAEPKRIERVGGTGLKVFWEDGHESLYGWSALRNACPCAACRETAKPGSTALPMAVHPLDLTPVGRYGMAVRWSDGHTTGIFSYDYLRSLCACEACKPDQFMDG